MSVFVDASSSGLKIASGLHFADEDARRRAGLLMEDLSMGVRAKLSLPRAVRDMFAEFSVKNRGSQILFLEMEATHTHVADLDVDLEDLLREILETFSTF